jgi:hypothetical protein
MKNITGALNIFLSVVAAALIGQKLKHSFPLFLILLIKTKAPNRDFCSF